MADHRPVTTTFRGERTAAVHFHCPCGVNRRITIVTNFDVHPIDRFTAALRRLHERGAWPQPEPEPELEEVAA